MVGQWHPVFAAVEDPPGVWSLRDQFGEYGRVELRRTVDGPRYRCEHRGEMVGWTTTLLGACEGVHGAYVAAHSPSGPARADWGD